MKIVALRVLSLTLFMFSIGCAESAVTRDSDNSCTIQGDRIVCPDGTEASIGDEITLTSVNIAKGDCVQIADGIYAENIKGKLIDVYKNSTCEDSKGEYCDNVIPSYGVSGSLGVDPHLGSGTVCWAESYQITAQKSSKTSTDILVRIVNFN